jgi:hypothetical protein
LTLEEPPISDSAAARRAVTQAWLTSTWCEVAGEYGALWGAQVAKQITGPQGWLKYLAKHSARGVRHYQRQGVPSGWTGTGRLWRHGGSWPVVEPVAGVMEQATFFRMRRLVRRRLIAQARAQGDWRRVAYLRRMLKNGDPTLSAVRGVSEWLPSDLFLTMAFAAGWSGELGAITDTSALPEVA